MLLSVFLWPQKDDETLWSKDAEQQTVTRGQDGKNLHGHRVFSRWAHVSGDKSHPDGTENQHAEGDQLGLVEVVGELPGEKGQKEAGAAQEANVAQHQRETRHRGHGTLQGHLQTRDLQVRSRLWGAKWQPNNADDNLEKEKKKETWSWQ